MFILGILIFIVVISIYILLGAQLNIFIDVGTIIYIVSSYFAILLMTNSFKEFSKGILLGYKKEMTMDIGALRKTEHVYKLLSKASWVIGFLGFIIRLMSMLSTLDDPSSLGAAMGSAFLALFYTVLINALLFIPVRLIIKKRETDYKLLYNKK